MKKGFTLVELLAVIVIMSVIFLIVVPSVDRTLKNNKLKLQNAQYALIKKGIKSYLAENVFLIPKNNFVMYVSYIQLVEDGYLPYKNADPASDNYYNPYTLLTITNTSGKMTYDIPTYANSNISKSTLDALPYCTVDYDIASSYTTPTVRCDDNIQAIIPTEELKGAIKVYTFNVGTGKNLYINIAKGE